MCKTEDWVEETKKFIRRKGRVNHNDVSEHIGADPDMVFELLRKLKAPGYAEIGLLSTRDVAKILGNSIKNVGAIVKRNMLSPVNDKQKFHVDDVREYIYLNRTTQEIKCYFCQKKVLGDMFCQRHLPWYMDPRPHPPKNVEIHSMEDDIMKKIGELMRQYREYHGYTQLDLAKKLGYSHHNVIHRVELGIIKVVDIEFIGSLFAVFGCEVSFTIKKD